MLVFEISLFIDEIVFDVGNPFQESIKPKMSRLFEEVDIFALREHRCGRGNRYHQRHCDQWGQLLEDYQAPKSNSFKYPLELLRNLETTIGQLRQSYLWRRYQTVKLPSEEEIKADNLEDIQFGQLLARDYSSDDSSSSNSSSSSSSDSSSGSSGDDSDSDEELPCQGCLAAYTLYLCGPSVLLCYLDDMTGIYAQNLDETIQVELMEEAAILIQAELGTAFAIQKSARNLYAYQ